MVLFFWNYPWFIFRGDMILFIQQNRKPCWQAILSLISLAYIFLGRVGSSHLTPAIDRSQGHSWNETAFDKCWVCVLGGAELLGLATKSVTEERESEGNPCKSIPYTIHRIVSAHLKFEKLLLIFWKWVSPESTEITSLNYDFTIIMDVCLIWDGQRVNCSSQ